MSRKVVSPARLALRILLREVWEQTPEGMATALVEAYRSGQKTISVTILESAHGPVICKCAFRWNVAEDDRPLSEARMRVKV